MSNKRPTRKPTPPEIKTLHWLKATFPQCFIKGEHKQPLKVGIHKDVLDYCEEHYPHEPQNLIKKAVAKYAQGTQYLTTLKAGAPRLDLQGNPCGVVTEEQQAHAEQQLKIREQRQLAKKET